MTGAESNNSVDDIVSYEESEINHRLDNLDLFIYMMLLVLTILTAWFFKHFRNRYMHETGLAVIYGLIIGVLIKETSTKVTSAITGTPAISANNSDADDPSGLSEKATFDPEIFFNLVLPAIIFHAGYSLKRRHFFVNIGAILMYAFIGTTISAVIIGTIIYLFCLIPYFDYLNFTFNDAMFYGAIISATDPVSVLAIFSELGVDVDLHALIMGESVLNDAVAIVLSGAVIDYAVNSKSDVDNAELKAVGAAIGKFFQVFIGAFSIGTVTALVTALLTKYTKLREFPLLESSLFLLMSYSTFLAAEAASFSGIVALLFCGIFQAHYTYYNLSAESKSSLRSITELLSFLAENFCFVQIGVTIFTFSKHLWDFYFILIVLLAIAIGRAVNIYPLTFIINRFSRRTIPLSFQHMLMFAGLRGAMAFALAIRKTETPPERIMFSTTLVIVMVTIFFCGTLVAPLLQFFHIRVGVAAATPKPVTSSRRRSSADRESNSYAESSLSYRHYSQRSEYQPVPTNEMQMNTSEEIPPGETQPRHRYNSKVIRGWKHVDLNYLKPLFTHNRPLLTETLPNNKCFQWIARMLTTTEQYQEGGINDTTGINSHHDLYGADISTRPTPSPPRLQIHTATGIDDPDDDPIVLMTDSPNIAGNQVSGDSPPRSAASSFTSNNSNLIFQ